MSWKTIAVIPMRKTKAIGECCEKAKCASKQCRAQRRTHWWGWWGFWWFCWWTWYKVPYCNRRWRSLREHITITCWKMIHASRAMLCKRLCIVSQQLYIMSDCLGIINGDCLPHWNQCMRRCSLKRALSSVNPPNWLVAQTLWLLVS